MSHHWMNKNGAEEIMVKRPYREINKPVKFGLANTVLGAVLVVLMGLALWFLLSIMPGGG